MQLSQHDDPVLAEMEEVARHTRFPIIDRAASKCCYLLCRLAKVRTVFEMGSGYGYSTAWFAMAVRDNGGGVVHHVVWDEELSRKAQDYLQRMNLSEFVRFTVGEAVETLRNTTGHFGCIFVDIEKAGLSAFAHRCRFGRSPVRGDPFSRLTPLLRISLSP